jgi:serine/threonine-protein kinase
LVDHGLAKRFERQAGIAASLRHAHIAPVLGFGVARSFLWYSMEFFGGRSLEEALRETGAMELESCLRIAEQVGSALDFAHRRGAVHGNLKPSNILVDDRGWVRVIDFGINEVFGRPRPARGSAPVLHLPEYLAPEQFYSRSVGASADQYAFGVVVYQCLAGSLPFLGDSFEEVARLHATPARVTLGGVLVAFTIGVGLLLWNPEWFAWTAPLLEGARSMVAPETARNATQQGPQWETLDPVGQFGRPEPVPAVPDATADPVELPPRATVQPAPPAPTAAPPLQPGRLFVNASPWGELYIDGQFIGNTPKANLDLSPGRHTIRVVRDGFEPFERQLDVASGQVVRLTDIVLVPQDR